MAVAFATATPLAHAQQAPAQVRDTTTRRTISPRSALFRSLLIPGWGQLSVGAYTRGAIFIAAQSSSWYMLLKTMSKLKDAKGTRDERLEFTSDTLRARIDAPQTPADSALARQLADPIAFNERVRTDSTVHRLEGLVESREQQRQDWITYTLFFTFASGVDAYVAAQLADFPATIDAEPTGDGGMKFQVNVPFPRRR